MELFNNPVMVWLILLLFFLIIEAATLGLMAIWCAVGALGGLAAAQFKLHAGIQFAVFAIITFSLMILMRPIVQRFFNRSRDKTKRDRMIGRRVVVLSEIDNLRHAGLVKLNGEEWLAGNFVDNSPIPEGELVVVRGVDGKRLMVERL